MLPVKVMGKLVHIAKIGSRMKYQAPLMGRNFTLIIGKSNRRIEQISEIRGLRSVPVQ
jgi:hypothetical protein